MGKTAEDLVGIELLSILLFLLSIVASLLKKTSNLISLMEDKRLTVLWPISTTIM